MPEIINLSSKWHARRQKTENLIQKPAGGIKSDVPEIADLQDKEEPQA